MTLTFPELYDAIRAGEIRVKRTDTGVRLLRGIGQQHVPADLLEAFEAHYDDLVAMMHDDALRDITKRLRTLFATDFVGFTETLEERHVIDHQQFTQGTEGRGILQAGSRDH